MAIATLTSKGQTTIPKDVREFLGVKPGDRLEFIPQEDGKVLLMPVNLELSDLKGILPALRKPVSLAEMEKAIRRRGSGL